MAWNGPANSISAAFTAFRPGGGALELVVEKSLFTQPNGLCFSPDEKLLYVNDTEQANIRVFDVEGGKLKNMRVFASGIADDAQPGRRPDGMKCDALGNIWCTGPDGLWVYAPDGRLARQGCRAGNGRQSALGRGRLAHVVHYRLDFALCAGDESRAAQGKLHERLYLSREIEGTGRCRNFRNGLLAAAMMLAPGLATAQVPGMTFPADPYTASSPLSRTHVPLAERIAHGGEPPNIQPHPSGA